MHVGMWQPSLNGPAAGVTPSIQQPNSDSMQRPVGIGSLLAQPRKFGPSAAVKPSGQQPYIDARQFSTPSRLSVTDL